jgi:coenzyme PQQ precursor peptide PqqA
MKNEPELVWSKPDFEEIGVCMECTAYAETL